MKTEPGFYQCEVKSVVPAEKHSGCCETEKRLFAVRWPSEPHSGRDRRAIFESGKGRARRTKRPHMPPPAVCGQTNDALDSFYARPKRAIHSATLGHRHEGDRPTQDAGCSQLKPFVCRRRIADANHVVDGNTGFRIASDYLGGEVTGIQFSGTLRHRRCLKPLGRAVEPRCCPGRAGTRWEPDRLP